MENNGMLGIGVIGVKLAARKIPEVFPEITVQRGLHNNFITGFSSILIQVRFFHAVF